MEGTIQLNTARNIDFTICSGKSMEKGNGEYPNKMFGEILLEMQEANEDEILMKIATKVAGAKKTGDECLVDFSCVAMAVDVPVEFCREKTEVCEKEIHDMRLGKTMANGLAKAQIAQEESKNMGFGNGVISSVFLRENADIGKLGETVKTPPTEFVDEFAGKIPEPGKASPFMEASEDSEILKPAETQTSEMPEKFQLSKTESDDELLFSKKSISENGFLQSARVRSILNRLSNMEMDMNEAEKAEDAKDHSALNRFSQKEMSTSESDVFSERQETKINFRNPIESKELFRDQIESKAKPDPKGKGTESLEKVIGQAAGGQALDGATKTEIKELGYTEKAFGGRAVENLEEIAEKIEFAMDKIRDNGKNSIRVRLKPEELGSIEIRLAQENGIVKGRIFVENESIKEQLNNFLAEEKASFLQEGQKPREIEVGVFNHQTGTFRDFNQGDFAFQREQENKGFSEFFGEKADSPIEQEEIRLDSYGLDMFA